MALLVRNKMSLTDRAKLENAEAREAQLLAVLEYNIMMGNIEDPTEDEDDE